LARAREYSGMNQSELARRLGVKLATLRNWETDRSEPRSNRLQMLSGLLGVSIVWLMSGEGGGAPAMDPDSSETLDEVLAELRELRLAQKRLSERTGLLEKRLKAFAAAG
jgi:transcriptional regulator with XRE-family HTH domain